MKKETISAETPVTNEIILDVNSLRLILGNRGKKSWLIFELVAQRSESAVEVIAAIIAQVQK